MNPDLQFIGEQIKSLRKAKGFSQDELANKIFVSRNTVSNIESGKTVIGLENLIDIIETLGISVSDVFPQRITFAADQSSAMYRISREYEKVPEEKKLATEQAILSVIKAVNM